VTERLPGIRPRPSVARRLDMIARRAFPASTTALLLLVSATPLGLPGQAELQQGAALGCVFFWSLYRPASMPPVVVFGLGLLLDLLSFAPVGVGVLTLLAAHGLAVTWRRALARRGFLVVWLCLVGVAAAAATLAWALTSLLIFRLLPPMPGVFQAMLSAGLYPALSVVLTRAHHTLAEPEHA
jgi:rod shape-determining protein MreD